MYTAAALVYMSRFELFRYPHRFLGYNSPFFMSLSLAALPFTAAHPIKVLLAYTRHPESFVHLLVRLVCDCFSLENSCGLLLCMQERSGKKGWRLCVL